MMYKIKIALLFLTVALWWYVVIWGASELKLLFEVHTAAGTWVTRHLKYVLTPLLAVWSTMIFSTHIKR